MKHKVIKVPIYDPAGYLIIIDQPDLNLIKKHYPDLYNMNQSSLEDIKNETNYTALTYLNVPYKDYHATYVVFNSKGKGTDFGVVSHECYHVMCNIYRKIQVYHSHVDDEEYSAYLLGWIVNQVSSVIDMKNILKNSCKK